MNSDVTNARKAIHLGWLILSLQALLLAGGCASYQFGAAALYPTGIRTVHVPIARNQTFRHDLGVRLTDALVQEIERRTPYKVVSSPAADSVLQCNVVNESKSVLTETENDDPRALDAAITVGATWTSRDGRSLLQNSVATARDPATGALLPGSEQIGFSQSIRFVPEAGQTIDTATQEAIERLARRIVSQMESRW